MKGGDAEYSNLITYTEVQKREIYNELDDPNWLGNLTFLAEIRKF